MLKTVADLLIVLNIDQTGRSALLVRIANKWKIEPVKSGYKKQFSEEDFFKIIIKEKEYRKIKKNNDNFNRKKKSSYQENKGRHLYSRLTDYGGLI